MSGPEPLTVGDLRRRPTITVQEYARFVGVSRDTVYEAAARGELRVLRLGRRVLVPTAPILEALGYALAQNEPEPES
jgi:excisionase family DNA binding protein